METLRKAINSAGGPTCAATACGVSPRAVHKWLSSGRLPRTEYTGETRYAETLAELSGGQFDGSELLESLKLNNTAA
jgi:hypothetical protein